MNAAAALERARQASRQLLRDVDLSAPANAAGTRRGQDVLTHIAAWEREVTASIVAAVAGRTHTLALPLDIDEQNERFYVASVSLSPTAAQAMWEDARREFIAAVDDLEAEFSITCPWGSVATLRHLVDDMIKHEAGHVQKLRSIQTPSADTPVNIVVRPEHPDDHAAIGHVITTAFAGAAYADGTEADIVERLRQAGALAVSLVAELDGAVIGHVAYSPARPAGDATGWYTLGPVAVLPEHQRLGLGAALIRAGLDALVATGAHGCIVLGDPAYYTRFGFEPAPDHAPTGSPGAYFMLTTFRDPPPHGPIGFHPAFDPTD